MYLFQRPHSEQQRLLASLLKEALDEAAKKDPLAPAVTLGLVLLKKVQRQEAIPSTIIRRAAMMLLPLCPEVAPMLRDYVQASMA